MPGRRASHPSGLVHRLALTAVVVATVSAGAGWAAVRDGAHPAPLAAAAVVDGSLSLADSRGGGAILSARDLAPGDAATGTVTIRNTGDVAGALALTSGPTRADRPGDLALLDALRLRITALDAGGAVYDGPVDGVDLPSVADLAPGGERSFRFTATLPDGGPSAVGRGDNRLQSASVVLAYDWSLTDAGPGDPGDPPTVPAGPETSPPGAAPGDGSVDPPGPAPGGGGPVTPEPPATTSPAPAAGPGPCARRLTGGRRADRLVGTAGGDRIAGGGGADRISGGAGDDCLSGGSGRDRISGGGGADRVDGGRGDDELFGDRGSDRITGGTGDDRVHARDGRRDVVDCGAGRDGATVDRVDRVRGCERVHRPGALRR